MEILFLMKHEMLLALMLVALLFAKVSGKTIGNNSLMP
jgi:hypothetical protein